MPETVRVRPDRRVCITAPMLESFARKAGLSAVPRRIHVRRSSSGIVLRWGTFEGSKPLAVSVRGRALVGGFEPNVELVVGGDASSLTLVEKTASPPPLSKKTTTKTGAAKVSPDRSNTTTPKNSTPTKEKAMPQSLTSLIVPGICTDIRNNHGGLSLLEVAKQLEELSPGLTVSTFLSSSRVILDYGALTREPKAERRPRARDRRRSPAAPAAKKAAAKAEGQEQSTRQIVADKLKAAGSAGVKSQQIATDTSKSILTIRAILNDMIAHGTVRRTGNTRGSRYFHVR